MINKILTYIRLFKVIKISKESLDIKFKESIIQFNNQGDIIIKAKRNLILEYDLLFQGCNEKYIEKITKYKKEGILQEQLETTKDEIILNEAKKQWQTLEQ